MKGLQMLRNIIYAMMLGVGMAACLSQSESEDTETETENITSTVAVTEENAPAQPAPEEFIIREGQVGSVRKGMLITDMRRQVPKGFTIKDTTLLQEGSPATAYILRPEGSSKGILIEQACEPECRVWRISVQHENYRTDKKIGIGSKYSEVRKKYPIKYVSPGEGVFVAVSEEKALSFILDVSNLKDQNLTKLEPEDVPANTLVKGILVY